MPSCRIASLALLGLAACKSIEETRIHAAYLQTEFGGDTALGPSGRRVSGRERRNDLVDDLGLDDSQPAMLIGGSIDTEFGRFGASAFWFDSSGSGTTSRDFGDIPVGTAVDTDMDFLNIKSFWVYDLIDEKTFRIGPGVAVNFIDVSTRVRSQTASQAFEEVDVTVPVPMLFVDTEWTIGPVYLAAQGGGMHIELADGFGTYWDAEARFGFTPTENVDLFAGYRLLTMDSDGQADARDAEVDLLLHGWFIGGAIAF